MFEKDQYYYHPDHLGSSSYVTDLDGEIFQHLEYFPFGETWVEEHSNTQRTPYLFTAKELDEETGLYYFGARYYDPRTSVWQSPDPILASYLPKLGATVDNSKDLPSGGGAFEPTNLNLYGYVQQRPTLFIDPNGEYKLDEARQSLRDRGVPYPPRRPRQRGPSFYSDTQVFDEWLRLEQADTSWQEGLPGCPSNVTPEKGYLPDGGEGQWNALAPVNQWAEGLYHPGTEEAYSMRSKPNEDGAGCQCIYTSDGRLARQGEYQRPVRGAMQDRAGTMDRVSPSVSVLRHRQEDVRPYTLAGRLGRLADYFSVRPLKVESEQVE